jgi:hypothetical protein
MVKLRYDGKGSEFGSAHRELPVSCGMFDIDRMSAIATINLEIKNQDVGFIEYRTNFNTGEITFKAMFEIKHKKGIASDQAIECKTGSATWAQLKMCQKLNCRYFIVIATEGNQPFEFYEKEYSGATKHCGTLSYTKETKKQEINNFWKKLSLI